MNNMQYLNLKFNYQQSHIKKLLIHLILNYGSKTFKIPSNQSEKRMGTQCIFVQSGYLQVICTSNKLFSRAKLVFEDRCQRMLPINLEIVLYLKLNRNRWSKIDIYDIYKEVHSKTISLV